MKFMKWIALSMIALLLLAGAARAGVEALGLTWWTVDSGGGDSTARGFSLNATIGQPDAGTLSGGQYTLVGGFWEGGQRVHQEWILFLPAVTR